MNEWMLEDFFQECYWNVWSGGCESEWWTGGRGGLCRAHDGPVYFGFGDSRQKLLAFGHLSWNNNPLCHSGLMKRSHRSRYDNRAGANGAAFVPSFTNTSTVFSFQRRLSENLSSENRSYSCVQADFHSVCIVFVSQEIHYQHCYIHSFMYTYQTVLEVFTSITTSIHPILLNFSTSSNPHPHDTRHFNECSSINIIDMYFSQLSF